jgi:hypothetical protein
VVTVNERVRGTVGALSSNCLRADTRTAGDCSEVARLREELAVADEAEGLDARRHQLRQHLSALRDQGGATPPDPVGEFWAWISRGIVSVKDVGFGLPLFFALMIEMVSAFGPLGIVAYAEATRPMTRERAAAGHVAPWHTTARSGGADRAAAGEREMGRVVQYMSERTEPTSSPKALGAEELFDDYELWCLTKDLRALPQQEFIQEFDRVREVPQLAGTIKKFGTRYFGIALTETSRSVLPAIRS